MWDTITNDYTYKSIFSQTFLYCKFTNACYPNKGDVWAFLNDLHTNKAELSAISIVINNNNYQYSIIQFLP